MCSGHDTTGLIKQAGAMSRQEMRRQQVAVFRKAFGPLLEEEVDALRDALGSDLDAFIEEFYGEHEERVEDALLPVVSDYGERVIEAAREELDDPPTVDGSGFASLYTAGLARRWRNDSVGQIQHLRQAEETPPEAIEERTERWEETRTEKVAERESTQAGAAFAKHAFLLGGASSLVWSAGFDACPLCARMDGRRVNITGAFLGEGDEVVGEDEGESRTLTVDRSIGHPPLHGMGGQGGVCDCTVSPG